MKPLKIIIVLITFIVIQSCVKDVDFDQVDDASIQTSYISTLVYFDLEPIKFLDEYNNEITWTSDFIEAPISTESQDYLERVEFTVITENTYNRDFKIDVVFFDENSAPVYQLKPSINILANSTTTTTIIEIPQNEIDVIYSTKYFGFSILMSNSEDGSVLSGNEDFKLNLKSSVQLFFNFRKI